MFVDTVRIERLRSIEKCEIKCCGPLNVLIGKNNSGKSNVLTAIRTFFECLRHGDVVTVDPPIGYKIDFFEETTSKPIDVTVVFALNSDECNKLVQGIVSEAPQVKNAAENLRMPLFAKIILNIVHEPERYAFVRELSIEERSVDGQVKSAEVLLALTDGAAAELYQKTSRARNLGRDIDGLSQLLAMDRDDLRRYLDLRAPGRPLAYILGRFVPLRGNVEELASQLESMVGQSSSYEDIMGAAQALLQKKKEEFSAVQGSPIKSPISTFAGAQPTVPNYAIGLLGQVSAMKVLHLTERRKPIGREEASYLLSLKVQRGGDELLRGIQDTVSTLLGVRIDAFEGSGRATRGERTAEMDVDDFLVEVNGSGIREALRLILDVESGEPQILLVEEPEIHLHPALELSIMRYLKDISAYCQIFITTHSTNFLDTAEMQNVYLVSKQDGSTKVELLDVEAAIAYLPRELGIRLSSFFMFDRLAFIEGPSDEAVLREWASLLKVNLAQANVAFIPMGGARNFTHFATEAVLSHLTRRQVHLWFLLDRDEKDEAEIARLRERIGDRAVVRVLAKRELENYLICSRAIVEFIGIKKNLAVPSGGRPEGEDVSTKAVETTISRVAEELKQMSVEKRVAHILCRPVFPALHSLFADTSGASIAKRISDEVQRMVGELELVTPRIADVLAEQQAAVEQMWESRKFDIVPGDLLLEAVCREYRVVFKKDRDSARLASLMRPEEIDPEIQRIIRELGNI